MIKIFQKPNNEISKGKIVALLVLSLLIVGGVQSGLAAQLGRNFENFQNLKTPVDVTQLPTAYQQSDPPSGWKTYEDLEFGFTISYPNEWQFEDATRKEKETDPSRVLFFRPQQLPLALQHAEIQDRPKADLAVVAVLMLMPQPMEAVAEKIVSYELMNPLKEDIMINGVAGIKIQGESLVWDVHANKSATEHRITYLIPNGSNTLTFSFTPRSVNAKQDFSVILSEMSKSLTIR